MSLQTSGQITANNIIAEFAFAKPFSLSANGGPRIGKNARTQIKFSEFYGKNSLVGVTLIDSAGTRSPRFTTSSSRYVTFNTINSNGWDNRATRIEVEAGVTVIAYQHPDKTGTNRTYSTAGTFTLPTGLAGDLSELQLDVRTV